MIKFENDYRKDCKEIEDRIQSPGALTSQGRKSESLQEVLREHWMSHFNRISLKSPS
jgi:hypothetical protein